jgi:predicted transcriptional regulator
MLKSREKNRLTPAETLIMDVVWDMSEATVKDVQERLHSEKPMAYNTVLTLMRILRDKGFLESHRDGRTDVYRPAISRREIGKNCLNDLLKNFFKGSATALVSQLLDNKSIPETEMEKIKREIEKRINQ